MKVRGRGIPIVSEGSRGNVGELGMVVGRQMWRKSDGGGDEDRKFE